MQHSGAPSSVGKDAWERTLADMERIATDLEEEGWGTLTVPAGGATLQSPNIGKTDRFGVIHVVPGNHADAFETQFGDCTVTAYDVFRREIEGEVYFVTALYAAEKHEVVLVAAAYRTTEEANLREAAVEEEAIYTHLQRLDGTLLRSVKHDEYEKFFESGDE